VIKFGKKPQIAQPLGLEDDASLKSDGEFAIEQNAKTASKQRTILYAAIGLVALGGTRDGRSQVAVIEEVLDRMPLPKQARDLEIFRARIDAILADVPKGEGSTMAAFDAATYDENGLPR
jgi:hypothetical protein